MFTGTVNFDIKNSKIAHFFKKSADHFQKLMFTGTVNFDFRKFEKSFFTKSVAHFQKLMFTGTMNFDYSKIRKMRIFLKNPPPIFKS